MNTLRGGVLRDVYALIYQLEHDTRSKGTVQVSLGYIGKRLGYDNERNIRRAIAELKEMGLMDVEYGNGKRSIFKIHTPAKIAHRLNCPPSPANIAAHTPYNISKDNRLDNTPPPPACARERLTEWYNASTLPEWTEMQFTRNGLPAIDTKTLLDEFYDNDFKVRERCEQSERMEVLSHFQNWLPKYIHKIKQPNNNGNNNSYTGSAQPAADQGKPYSRVQELANTKFRLE